MDSVCSALKLFRKNNSLTQREVAEALSIDKSHVSKMESGEDFLTKEVFLNYCKLFDFDMNRAKEFADAIFKPATITTRDKDVADAALKVFQKLDEYHTLQRKQKMEDTINLIFEKIDSNSDINDNVRHR